LGELTEPYRRPISDISRRLEELKRLLQSGSSESEIFPPDGRRLVSNTLLVPFRFVCCLEITFVNPVPRNHSGPTGVSRSGLDPVGSTDRVVNPAPADMPGMIRTWPTRSWGKAVDLSGLTGRASETSSAINTTAYPRRTTPFDKIANMGVRNHRAGVQAPARLDEGGWRQRHVLTASCDSQHNAYNRARHPWKDNSPTQDPLSARLFTARGYH
jgi:hypothetical protein